MNENNNKNSTLSVVALILSIIGCTSFIGLILAIVDLVKNKYNKKTLSIIALVINGVWFLIWIMVFFFAFSSGSSDDKTTKSDKSNKTKIESKDDDTNDETDDETVDNSDLKSQCQSLDYQSILRTPKDYEGQYVTFEGKVVQVQESDSWTSDDVKVTLRVAEENDDDKIWWVEYTRTDTNEDRILEDDYVTVYGECTGIQKYEALLGNEITIPAVDAFEVIIGKVDENNNVSKFDKDEIVNQLKITEYECKGEYSNYYYLVVENNSDYQLDLEVPVKYLDESGNVIGTDDGYVNCLDVGNKCLITFYPDEDFSDVEYKIDASMCEYSKPANDNITYEVSELDEKLIVTVKNTSEETIDSVEVEALFFLNGEVIGDSSAYFNDSDYEFKAGDEMTEEINIYEAYDSYELFVTATK